MLQLMYVLFATMWGHLRARIPLRRPTGAQIYSFVIRSSEHVHDLMMLLAIPFIILLLSSFATAKSIWKLCKDFDQYLEYVAQQHAQQQGQQQQDHQQLDHWQQEHWDDWQNQDW